MPAKLTPQGAYRLSAQLRQLIDARHNRCDDCFNVGRSGIEHSMVGIKIQDSTESAGGGALLSFELRDILEAVGEPALESELRGRDLYYLVMRDGVCGEFDEARCNFSGKEFVEFAATVHQTIDGECTAKRPGSNKAW